VPPPIHVPPRVGPEAPKMVEAPPRLSLPRGRRPAASWKAGGESLLVTHVGCPDYSDARSPWQTDVQLLKKQEYLTAAAAYWYHQGRLPLLLHVLWCRRNFFDPEAKMARARYLVKLARSLQRVLHPDKHPDAPQEHTKLTGAISGELIAEYDRLRAEDELLMTSDTLVEPTPDLCPIGNMAFAAPPQEFAGDCVAPPPPPPPPPAAAQQPEAPSDPRITGKGAGGPFASGPRTTGETASAASGSEQPPPAGVASSRGPDPPGPHTASRCPFTDVRETPEYKRQKEEERRRAEDFWHIANTAGDGLRSAYRTEEEATAEQEPWSKRPRLPQIRELPPVPVYYEKVGKRRMAKIRATLNTGWPTQHDVPGLHAPHMRWRQALRQALFATLAIYPDPMVDLEKLEAE